MSTLRRTIPLAAGAVAALIVATSVTAAQAEPTTPAEEPYAAVYAANTTGGCSLDVYGWTSVPANLYINNRRSEFLAPNEGFAFRLDASRGVQGTNLLQVRERDTVVLATYSMNADCAPTPPPSTSSAPTVSATPTAGVTATPTPPADVTTTSPSAGATQTPEASGGLASTGAER